MIKITKSTSTTGSVNIFITEEDIQSIVAERLGLDPNKVDFHWETSMGDTLIAGMNIRYDRHGEDEEETIEDDGDSDFSFPESFLGSTF